MQPTVRLPQQWTFEDLQALPEDVDWRRYEIVDGALVVSPPPGVEHEFVVAGVRAMIQTALPLGLAILGPFGVDLSGSYRIPDLLVVDTALRGRGGNLLRPGDVLLVVEVVSPGSVTTDRVTKPAQYAAAGIGAFWRVETEPVSLTAYTLPAGQSVYAELGGWQLGEVAHLHDPFPVDIAIDALAPRPA